METKEVCCSVVKELMVGTGEIKMAKSSFMRSVNTEKKCPEDLIEATEILICKKGMQQTQQKFRDLASSVGKTCEFCEETKYGNSQENQRRNSIHELCSLLFPLSIWGFQLNYLVKIIQNEMLKCSLVVGKFV